MYTSAHASSLTPHPLTHSYKQKQKMHLLRKKILSIKIVIKITSIGENHD